MAEKKLGFTAEEIDELLRKVDEGESGGASPEQIQQIQKNKDDIDALKVEKLDVESVAEWAKQPQKPEYTPEEIGAQPKGAYITSESDPTVPNWAKSPTKPSYTATEIGAEPANAVSGHNTATDAHNDIRLWLSNVETWVKNLLDADDETLNQTSEMIQYMKDNRELIEQITTGKVSVTDIINNLTTNVSDKPLSAAQGVVLKGLIDALQTAVNAAAKATDLTSHAENTSVHITAAERTKWNQAVTDVGNLSEEIVDEVTAREQAVADLNARLGQQTVLIAEGETQEEAEAWLESNADKTKVYLMPDDTFWQYREVTEIIEGGGVAYTNQLPLATDTDRKTIFNGKGYQLEKRLSSSSGSVSAVNAGTDCGVSGFIPAKVDDTFELQGGYSAVDVGVYLMTYNSSNVKVGHKDLWGHNGVSWGNFDNAPWQKYDAERNVLTIKLTSEYFGTGFDAIRFSAGGIDENTIVTINEEIRESSGTTTTIVEKWATTGHGLTATNYDAVIATINNTLNAHTEEINDLREMIESGQIGTDVDPLDLIRNWDAPIYDANIPVFSLETEKAAKTNATNTPDAIYAMYDALMAKYPKYITKTDLGVCSDGVNHVYRYDFREPEPYHQSNMPWSETKTKAILVSGIHYEWAGIYSLYYALEEITENPKLFDLRRNTHFIVIPVINPYCTITANYNASIGVLNANGVQIHRNFEVGFIYPGESGYVEFGERNHGGTAPLSEMETQCLDNIFKANTDAAFFLTCHNFDSPSATNGLGFIWPSSATKYMCNMGYRLIDKMTKLWLDKYGDELEAGIADYRTDNVSDDFIRFGHAHMSLTDGTETRQATKYGIQGNNVEVCGRFYPHGTKANVEPSLSEFTLSRGAETYINFLLTACGVYDYKDKALYTV